MRFIANFRYNLKKSIAQDPLQKAQDEGIIAFPSIESGDYNKFDSQCSKTMVGFVQNDPKVSGMSYSLAKHHVQCFHAVQEKHYEIEKTEAHNTGKMKFNKIIQHTEVKPEKI
jgi:hypothetical protein